MGQAIQFIRSVYDFSIGSAVQESTPKLQVCKFNGEICVDTNKKVTAFISRKIIVNFIKERCQKFVEVVDEHIDAYNRVVK